MIRTRTKRKIVIKKVEITQFEKFIPIEIKLPTNVKKVTGIMATTSDTWTLLEP
jgi:hypothetical protein